MYAGTEVRMDEDGQDQEGGAGLYTLGLACCIGIGVCGTYNKKAEPGEVRYDAFLAHLADGPQMEKTWQSLKTKVDLAKSKGLANLKIRICVVNPATLKEDETPGMTWSQAMVLEQQKINDDYVARAAGLLGAVSQGLDVQGHHINNDIDMRVTRDRKTLILDS